MTLVEESILKQKSRNQWLKLGDSNNSYFFACTKTKLAQNGIRSLTKADRIVVVEFGDIEKEAIGFYKGLLGSAEDHIPAINPAVMQHSPIPNRQQQKQLIEEVTEEEVINALQSSDITKAVLEFFTIGKLHKPVNCTSVTLIPNIQSPKSIKEYRPISCCLVMNKIILKILTHWMQVVMDSLVNNSQSAFVSNRVIYDNIILSHELVKSYGRKGVSPRCMLNIDMQKAYALVDRRYLRHILYTLNFPDKFVNWGDNWSVKILNECFLEFSEAYGLKANLDKSSVFFGGVPDEDQEEILNILGFVRGTLPIRYLGAGAKPGISSRVFIL
ncbi:uncharacterized protein LOC132630352 [Lycium barbarum]|uniref:uncharacterized protein LOC132630352 n=1 Tax=Lycium barbarum TaxID=112863 RepID=UPI00293E12E0|nr:uncharacterized protein LOC132630352 [Lycium barbarum]